MSLLLQYNGALSLLFCLACAVIPLTSLLAQSHWSSCQLTLTPDCSAHTEGGELAADEAEETDSAQSRRGLFWVPPADDEPGQCDTLHLDDELAGLIEAADTPADGHTAHVRKPEPTSLMQGEGSVEQSQKCAVVVMPLQCQLWLYVTRLTLCAATCLVKQLCLHTLTKPTCCSCGRAMHRNQHGSRQARQCQMLCWI